MQTGHAEAFASQALDMHRRYPVILIHDHEPLADDLAACQAGGISGKVLLPVLDVMMTQAEPMASGPLREGWAEHAQGEFQRVLASIQASGGQALLATSTADFLRAHQQGQVAVMLGSEGGKLIEGDLGLLPEFYRMGYRLMQLAWNYGNQITRVQISEEGPGLTAFGRELIPELNRLGIIIDVAHLGPLTCRQVAELSAQPVVLSHGGAATEYWRRARPDGRPGRRVSFADDELLGLLAQTGGLLGINFFGPLFWGERQAHDTAIEDVVEHFQYVADKFGVDVLALGCDYFPNHGGWVHLLPERDATRDYFVLPKTALARFAAHLLARGWGEADIAKVLGGNFLRLCTRVLHPDVSG